MTTTEAPTREEVLERLAIDTPLWTSNLAKIVPKKRSLGLVPLEPKAAQLELDKRLDEQRRAGKPQRAIVLKARQIGISTWTQAKLIQWATLRPHLSALVVAHDVETGGKLFAMGQRMYSNLPNEDPLKPPIRSHKRARFLHFGQRGEAWMEGEIYPDSTYWVDTAGEFEAGRGGTYHAVHFSEFAFFPQPEQKYVAIAQAIPMDPDTLWIIESTANGMNKFKDLWDDAVEGRSEFIPFFWPWWKEDEYQLPFVNEAERQEFQIGNTDQSPYADGERELVDPGSYDVLEDRNVPLTLEQLKWRRWAIANQTGGSIEKFHQEYPSTPEEAFLSTGQKVFEPALVSLAMREAENTDPRVGRGGPIVGLLKATERPTRAGRAGPIDVPSAPEWKPARACLPGEEPDWRVWLDEKDGKPVVPEDGLYVIGVDVSGGIAESGEEGGEPAYHAIQVIDHRTKAQVAEYRSRCDPALLSEYAYLTALFFNEAWLAIEVTGHYGLPVARTIALDFRYRFMYRRKRHETREEREVDRLGWDTSRSTKPILLAGGQELLREGSHGIKSRRLVGEMQTYIRTSTGKTQPERGRFADLLMAWLIAQQVALEMPIRQKRDAKPGAGWRPSNPVTGY